jgi:hypothetical protein
MVSAWPVIDCPNRSGKILIPGFDFTFGLQQDKEAP